jgi:hypothetical protein
MEQSLIAIESVKNLQASRKRLLEDVVGQPLQENQEVLIMVFSPGKLPDDVVRGKVRAELKATFEKTQAHAIEYAITDEEIEAALHEAMDTVRPRK